MTKTTKTHSGITGRCGAMKQGYPSITRPLRNERTEEEHTCFPIAASQDYRYDLIYHRLVSKATLPMRLLTISTLLSGVSAVCVLPTSARYFARPDPNFSPALLLTTNYPPVKFGLYKDHACDREPTSGAVYHWRCAYGPKLKATNCHNDYTIRLSNSFVTNSGRPCHVDTTNQENNGVWVCVLE